MDEKKITPSEPGLQGHLELLGLPFMRDNYDVLAHQAAQKEWSNIDYLAALAAHDASRLPVAPHVRFTENGIATR